MNYTRLSAVPNSTLLTRISYSYSYDILITTPSHTAAIYNDVTVDGVCDPSPPSLQRDDALLDASALVGVLAPAADAIYCAV